MRPLVLMLAAACATSSSYGVVSMKEVFGPTAPPGVLQVGPGRVTGANLDLREENGCVTGYYGRRPVSFCRDDKGDGPEQHWSGPTGDFFLRREGGVYQVSGNILSGGSPVPLNESIPIGSGTGKAWQELVAHPALLAVLENLPALR